MLRDFVVHVGRLSHIWLTLKRQLRSVAISFIDIVCNIIYS